MVALCLNHNPAVSILKACWSAIISMKATSVLKSIIPTGGSIERIGSRRGSVMLYKNRAIGLVKGSMRSQENSTRISKRKEYSVRRKLIVSIIVLTDCLSSFVVSRSLTSGVTLAKKYCVQVHYRRSFSYSNLEVTSLGFEHQTTLKSHIPLCSPSR